MKKGEFIGQFDRLATQPEIEAFKKVIEEAAAESGFKYLMLKVGEQDNKCGFYGYSSLPITLDTGMFKSIKKYNGDKVYDFSSITFYIQMQDGFSSYEEIKSYEAKLGGSLKGYGKDIFTDKSYSITAKTDGRYHKYRTHYVHDYRYEGKGHFMYDTTISDFKAELVEYFNNIQRGL